MEAARPRYQEVPVCHLQTGGDHRAIHIDIMAQTAIILLYVSCRAVSSEMQLEIPQFE